MASSPHQDEHPTAEPGSCTPWPRRHSCRPQRHQAMHIQPRQPLVSMPPFFSLTCQTIEFDRYGRPRRSTTSTSLLRLFLDPATRDVCVHSGDFSQRTAKDSGHYHAPTLATVTHRSPLSIRVRRAASHGDLPVSELPSLLRLPSTTSMQNCCNAS